MFAGIADLVAFIHLLHWPVVEPERMKSVLAHLEAIPPLSRENWKRILAETDSGKEWIPNPRQTGVLPGVTMTQEQIDGWMAFLDEFEALLKGEKLLPHWRFEKGINLRRIFLEPTTFDVVLLIQGSAAIPYLEDGVLTTGETWRRIDGLLARQFHPLRALVQLKQDSRKNVDFENRRRHRRLSARCGSPRRSAASTIASRSRSPTRPIRRIRSAGRIRSAKFRRSSSRTERCSTIPPSSSISSMPRPAAA